MITQLASLIAAFSIPQEIQSDHGSEFKNDKMKALLDNCGIPPLKSGVPGNPAANGGVEGANRCIW